MNMCPRPGPAFLNHQVCYATALEVGVHHTSNIIKDFDGEDKTDEAIKTACVLLHQT